MMDQHILGGGNKSLKWFVLLKGSPFTPSNDTKFVANTEN